VGEANRCFERALLLHQRYLELRPRSFWGHYRAASASFALRRFSLAADLLRPCIKRWPRNPALHLGLAACLVEIGRNDEALEECRLAEQEAPDLPQIYQSRAYIRAVSGRTAGIDQDLQRYEMLAGLLPSTYYRPGWIAELSRDSSPLQTIPPSPPWDTPNQPKHPRPYLQSPPRNRIRPVPRRSA